MRDPNPSNILWTPFQVVGGGGGGGGGWTSNQIFKKGELDQGLDF